MATKKTKDVELSTGIIAQECDTWVDTMYEALSARVDVLATEVAKLTTKTGMGQSLNDYGYNVSSKDIGKYTE